MWADYVVERVVQYLSQRVIVSHCGPLTVCVSLCVCVTVCHTAELPCVAEAVRRYVKNETALQHQALLMLGLALVLRRKVSAVRAMWASMQTLVG